MSGKGRIRKSLAAIGTVVVAMVLYWWLSNVVLSSLEAVGVIDGRIYMPLMSDSGQVSVALPKAKGSGSDGPLLDYEEPAIQLESDSEYHDCGLLDYPYWMGQESEITKGLEFDLNKLDFGSALSIEESHRLPYQEKWTWPDTLLQRYLNRYDFQPVDPKLFEPPESPDFPIPKWMPEPIPRMVLPHLNPGYRKWSDQYQSINPVVPMMPAVQDLNRAFARQIGQ